MWSARRWTRWTPSSATGTGSPGRSPADTTTWPTRAACRKPRSTTLLSPLVGGQTCLRRPRQGARAHSSVRCARSSRLPRVPSGGCAQVRTGARPRLRLGRLAWPRHRVYLPQRAACRHLFHARCNGKSRRGGAGPDGRHRERLDREPLHLRSDLSSTAVSLFARVRECRRCADRYGPRSGPTVARVCTS